MVGGLR
jgi:hypothetical protein